MKDQSLREFEELVSLTVGALQDKAYGVSILESLEAKAGKRFNISAIHVALKRMEDKGFVKSYYGGITEERGGRRKKFYVVTALGRKVRDHRFDLRTALYHKLPKFAFSI